MAEPFVDLGFARVDTDRARRCGFPEVVFGAGKTPEEVLAIGRVLLERNGVLLVSRASAEQHRVLSTEFPAALVARTRPLPHRRAATLAEKRGRRRCHLRGHVGSAGRR